MGRRCPAEDAVGRATGDKIAGATGADIKLRAERKLGGRAKPWPHTGSVSSSALAARSGPWNTPCRSQLGIPVLGRAGQQAPRRRPGPTAGATRAIRFPE